MKSFVLSGDDMSKILISIEKGIISLGKEELEDIIKTEEKIETVCHFCNEKYAFTKQELENILKNM